jgi:hypothetical protein
MKCFFEGNMKSKFLSGLFGLMLVSAASAQTEFYVNDGVVLCPPGIPPQVNAVNFVNSNYFNINFTNPFVLNPTLYETASTLNYTNARMMIANTGFRFETSPSTGGIRRMAGNFNNSGTISVGATANNTNTAFNLFTAVAGFPKLLISATNVVNSGTNVIGRNGLYSLVGKKVDMGRGLITTEGFEVSTNSLSPIVGLPECITPGLTNEPGIFDRYWGNDFAQIDACVNFGSVPIQTPPHLVSGYGGSSFTKTIQFPGATTYVDETFLNSTSRIVRIVFLNNTNSSVANNIYFRPFSPFLSFANGHTVVEWVAAVTNSATGGVVTNNLYLFDNQNYGFLFNNSSDPVFGFFRFCTNFFVTNGLVANFGDLNDGLFVQPTYRPFNYTFFNRRISQAGLLGAPASPSSFSFNCLPVFVSSSAYGVTFSPTTHLPGRVQGGVLTNMMGRVEIGADSQLDLTRARIAALNYMGLKATNHFVGSSRASISSPWSDISLGSTNGNLNITNLLAPTVPRWSGEVDLYSGSWADFTFFPGLTVRSEYHVLFVDSRLSPVAPALVQDLTLRSRNNAGGSDNMIISDVYNVTRNLMLETERLTITSNAPPALTPRGEINLLSSAITWPTSTPRLSYLTNNGVIRAQNAVFFGGSRGSPFYNSNFDEPYIAFVNRGGITNQGSLIWANYFENSGIFTTAEGFGSISLASQITRMTNGGFIAPQGDISINTGELIVTNHEFKTGGKLTLGATGLLTDTGGTNANTWIAKAISLPVKPAAGDLLATTIFSTASSFEGVTDTWAAEDRGCGSAGYTNNVAIGRLILDGGDDSLFAFTGTGANNAIYIDYLELRNFMTNRDVAGNFIGLQIDPNMKVYFAQAVASGVSIAEKLDKQNDGRLCWVSDYAGTFSGANVIYPDGSTNYFNAALVGSCNLDSDGDGLVNCSDPTPILRPQDLGLVVSLVNSPALKAQVSWQSGPYAANYVYYNTNSSSSNWQLLTNFVSGPLGGRVSVTDPVNPSRPRYYRVRVDPNQP